MSENVIWTIKNGEFDAVQEAFKNDVLKVNEEIKGRYPIHYAADFGQLKVLEFLILKGADVNKKDKHGITPLLAAIWEGHKSCVELLWKREQTKASLLQMAKVILKQQRAMKSRNFLSKL